jgi:hypothetical protein
MWLGRIGSEAGDAGSYRDVIAVTMALVIASPAARAADFEVRSPIIDPDEFEFDAKIAHASGRRSAPTRGSSLVGEFEYGVSEWWSPAIEAEWNRPAAPDERTGIEAFTFENRFQLAPEGRYWLDPGLFVEYERAAARGTPDVVRLGPLLRKEFGPTRNVLNLLAVKRLGGSHAGVSYSYAWQTQWTVSDLLQPGFELYGGAGEADTATTQHRGGPVFFGTFRFGGGHDIRYEIGYLLGLNRATPGGTFKLLIGYEVQF